VAPWRNRLCQNNGLAMLSLDEALDQRKGSRLVFTNGVFDLIHAGHVRLLNHAKSLGDLLFVGLNSDLSVRGLGKGPHRPIHTETERAEVLSSFRSVDGVIVFDEPTPIALIERLRPEVHVKGGDYRVEDLPESSVVHRYGGQVVIVPLVTGRSSTKLAQEYGLE